MGRESLIIAIDPKDSSANPFTRAFSQAIAEQGFNVVSFSWKWRSLIQNDVVILHWPDRLQQASTVHATFVSLKAYTKLWIARHVYGVRFIWVAHNIRPHESKRRSTLLESLFLKSLDGIIHLSAFSKKFLKDSVRRPVRVLELVTVHGDYCDVMETRPVLPPPADGQIELLSVGRVRQYKNLERLASEMVQTATSDVRLSIVGWRSNACEADALEAITQSAPGVILDLHAAELSHSYIEQAIDRSHAVVLPYRSILNSGTAILALSRGRPVLAPRTGSLPELQQIVGDRWLRLYDGDFSADQLTRFSEWIRTFQSDGGPNLERLRWKPIGRELAVFVQRVLAGKRTAARDELQQPYAAAPVCDALQLSADNA